MPIIHAIVLGLVQGLSEFLPISSSGHLLLVPWLFGWNDFADVGVEKAFDVAMHLGTLVAVGVLAMFDQAQTAELLGIIREGLSNVVRHAKARQCTVTLREVEGAIVLEIKDDGVGGAVVSRSRSGRSHGLRNMAARAKKIGASFALMSGKGAGTTVQVRILRG